MIKRMFGRLVKANGRISRDACCRCCPPLGAETTGTVTIVTSGTCLRPQNQPACNLVAGTFTYYATTNYYTSQYGYYKQFSISWRNGDWGFGITWSIASGAPCGHWRMNMAGWINGGNYYLFASDTNFTPVLVNGKINGTFILPAYGLGTPYQYNYNQCTGMTATVTFNP